MTTEGSSAGKNTGPMMVANAPYRANAAEALPPGPRCRHVCQGKRQTKWSIRTPLFASSCKIIRSSVGVAATCITVRS